MQRWEQQPFQDYTEDHGEHGVSTSCPLHYHFSLYLIQPKDSADKYETFQSKHMVSIYHSRQQRHSANLISSPILQFQKHSEIAWSIFIHAVFLTLFVILMCYFSSQSVSSSIEVSLSGSHFDLSQGENINIKIKGSMLFISSDSRI